MRAYLTQDWSYLESLMREPENYERMSDDKCMAVVPRDQLSLKPLKEQGRCRVIEVSNDESKVGAFLFSKKGDREWEVHTVLSKQARGLLAMRAAEEALKTAFNILGARVLYSQCPMSNPPALWFALRNGFTEVDRKKDWVKDGRTYESVYVRLTRKEWSKKCQQSYQYCH